MLLCFVKSHPAILQGLYHTASSLHLELLPTLSFPFCEYRGVELLHYVAARGPL